MNVIQEFHSDHYRNSSKCASKGRGSEIIAWNATRADL